MSSASQILERDSELARIAEALDSAVAGSGRVLVIEGLAGIGKTRLVGETRDLARTRGFGRLQATGDETETAMAWGVVRQMVERSVSRYSGDTRRAILDGPAGAALQALDVAPEGTASDAEIARTLHALWWVAIDLSADRPLLITVDDAQWSDQPSLRFLGYLARRIADLPIALVLGTRPPTGGSGPLTELTVSPYVERLLPQALSPTAVAAFHTPQGVVPCVQVVTAMHAACGGNPFLTGALLDELVSAGHDVADPVTAEAIGGLGPATISRAMLSRLSPDALALAGAAAVLGVEASPWLARRVARLDDSALEPAVADLVQANVMLGGADGLTFVHPVIREATVAALGSLGVAGMHARAAVELRAGHAPATQLASHLLTAPVGTLPDAADLLAEAAQFSLAAGDRAIAADCLERALVERPGDPVLRERLGSTLLRAGRPAEAHRHLVEAAAAATDSSRRAELQAAAAQATLATAGAEAAVTELVSTLRAWPPLADAPHRITLEAALGVTRQFVPSQRRESLEHLRGFEDLRGDTSDERTILALLAQRGRHQNQPHTIVADYGRRALGEGALFDDAARAEGLVPWTLAMMAAISADVVVETKQEIERARTRILLGGSPVDYAMAANAAQMLAWRTGNVDTTETESEAVLAAIAHEPPTPETLSLRVTAVHFACYVAFERRDLASAKSALAGLDSQTQAVRIIPLLWLHEVRARVSLAEDDPHGALKHVETLTREIEQVGVDPAGLAWRLPAAIAHSRLGHGELTQTLLAEQVELARTWGSPTELGAALRVAARFAPDPDARADRLGEAVHVLADAHDRLEHAKSLTDQAESWRAQGRRTESRDLLAGAGELAHACGATALQTRIAQALAALGDRPRRQTSPGPESLTASERRVATLAVIGRTNRDIAQELFVSPKTVENHLGRVYTKLGIGSRRELAGAMA